MLTEDREKLRVLQPLQPWFSQEQREELAEVHPWIQQHTIPQEIDTQVGILNHTNTPQTYLSFYSTWAQVQTYFCVSQGCVSCSAAAGVAHSPLPPAPDSSCPLERPEQDSIGPVVDTWETLKPKEPTTQLTENQPCQKPCQLLPRISSDQCEGNGSLCFSVKLNIFCKGISGWTRPRRTQESRAMGIFTVSQVL